MGVTAPAESVSGAGCGVTFELRCLPHAPDANGERSCDRGAGAPLAVAAGTSADCARVDVQGGTFQLKPHRHRYRGKRGFGRTPGSAPVAAACEAVGESEQLREVGVGVKVHVPIGRRVRRAVRRVQRSGVASFLSDANILRPFFSVISTTAQPEPVLLPSIRR